MAGSTASPVDGKRRKRAETSKNELLMEAVWRGELTNVRRLVDRGGADVSTVNQRGLSCLQLAIVGGHVKLAEYLVQKGANIFSIDSQGWTALHDAAQMDMRALVKKLISKGCKLTATTDQGELPIDVAGSVEMERMLCVELYARGEEQLSRDYERYLGLKYLEGSPSKKRVVFHPSHRGTLPLCYTGVRSPPRLQRKHTSPAFFTTDQRSPAHRVKSLAAVKRRENPADPSTNRVVMAGTEPHGGAEGSDVDIGKSVSEMTSSEEITSSTKLQDAVIDRPAPTHESSRHSQSSGFGDRINTSRHHRVASIASNRNNIVGSRCLLRSSASISAALGVCFDAISTTFDEDTLSRDILERSPSSEATSNAVLSSQAQNNLRPAKRGVSFCDQTMARTKASSSPVATAEKERAVILGKGDTSEEDFESCCSEETEKRDEGARGGSSSDGESEELPASSLEAIANLKRKPRKSSIVTADRRRNLGVLGRRRSVTFQPEVLLQEMVVDGDVKAVCEILVSGILNDVNKLSPAGLTALHQSSIDGNLACAKALVANGACVNSVDCELWTPLHAAAMTGRIDIVRFLLTNGADSHLKNEANETAYDVAKSGPIRKLLLCSMNEKSLDADEISDGEYSDEEEREYSHAESESDDGEEPYYFDFPKTSHQSSASPSPDLTEHSDSVFMNGAKSPEPESAVQTRKARDVFDSSSSYSSILEQDVERVRDTDQRSHSKPNNNHFSGMEDPNTVDVISEDQGISTMEGSSDCSHRSRILSEDEGTLRDVLDSELVPGSLDYRFQEACLYCQEDSLLKLARHRDEIQVNRINKSSGITALHHAVLEENFAMVQHLVKEFNADVQIKDRDGWVPLHAASAVGNIRIAQFLLDCGAKASVLNSQCEFPVDVAEDEAMEKLLKNAMLGPTVGELFKGKFA